MPGSGLSGTARKAVDAQWRTGLHVCALKLPRVRTHREGKPVLFVNTSAFIALNHRADQAIDGIARIAIMRSPHVDTYAGLR